MPRPPHPRALHYATAAVLVYLCMNLLGYWLQESLIFHPRPLAADYTYQFPGHPFTEHFIAMPDGARLNVLWFKQDKPKGAVVYCHGNADNLQRWGMHVADFAPLGYDLIIWDYRGFGKSTGTLSEPALYADAQAVYDFARQHFAAERITIYGRSLGTGVATRLAKDSPAQRLVLETPYYSLAELSLYYAPFLPAHWLLKYELRTDLWLPQVQCPIAIFHGTDDWVVPYRSGQKLQALLKASDRFVTIPNGQHRNLNTFAEYHTALKEILE